MLSTLVIHIVKEVANLVKDIFFEKEEKQIKIEEEVKDLFKEEPKEEIKENSLLSVNVCGIYSFSKTRILLTGNESKLLNETKRKKYRPVIISKIRNGNVYFFALTSNIYAYKRKNISFELRYCDFFNVKTCRIPNFPPSNLEKASSTIFFRSVNRKGNYRKNQKALFAISLSVLKRMKNFSDLPEEQKIDAKSLCDFHDNYDLLIECGECEKEYINIILKSINEGRKHGRKPKGKRRNY